jgi:hypothetical protein
MDIDIEYARLRPYRLICNIYRVENDETFFLAFNFNKLILGNQILEFGRELEKK